MRSVRDSSRVLQFESFMNGFFVNIRRVCLREWLSRTAVEPALVLALVLLRGCYLRTFSRPCVLRKESRVHCSSCVCRTTTANSALAEVANGSRGLLNIHEGLATMVCELCVASFASFTKFFVQRTVHEIINVALHKHTHTQT